jgi:esterase/lipase superfamily enzyme
MLKLSLRYLGLTAIIAFLPITSAWAQQPPRMSADLTRDVRDVKVQQQLIALGVLDTTAGRASIGELSEAVAWFRRAYQSNRGMAGLSDDEKEKLKQAKAKFDAATGLKETVHKDRNPKTTTDLTLLVPLKLVPETPQKFETDAAGVESQEYRNGKVAIGPVVYLLSDFTPIALFRQSIMQVALTYKHLHLTSDEFAAVGETDEADGFVSANLVLTSKDKLIGVLIRYPKVPPASFELPDFLAPVVANEKPQPGKETSDARARGWQLLMQGVANLVVGEFPRQNGWQAVSTQPCPLTDQNSEQTKGVRVVFGTDRKAKDGINKLDGPVSDANSLFANEPGNQLHLGCAYVVPPIQGAKGTGVLGESKITQFRLLHSTDKADIGDQLYLTDEIAESARTASRVVLGKPVRQRGHKSRVSSDQHVSSALVFIHGYNVTFQDALFTIAQLKADTNYPGRVYMYSWPSAASTFGYIADMDQAEQAEPFLQSFMRLLMRDADIDAIDIIAHSMGSQSTLRALSSLRSVFETQRQGETRQETIRIGQIMFAAPDVAMPVFDQKIRRIAPYADRVTVYASMTDAALLASKILRSGASRMGQLGDDGQPLLVEVKNVHLIDATGPERWWRLDRIMQGYGHDYFRQSAGVLKDIQRILRSIGKDDTQTPKERSPAEFEEMPFKQNSKWTFWRLKENEKLATKAN